MKLSDVKIKSAKPKDKLYKLSDGEGLFLIVSPAEKPSRGKRWSWRYWDADGKERTLSLGTYPDVSLAMARERRDTARKQLKEGKDPNAVKREAKQEKVLASANGFETVALEYFKVRSDWTPKYSESVRRRFELDVFPEIGAKPVKEIKPADVLRAVKRLEARGATELSHRVLQLCVQVFKFAIASGRLEINPADSIGLALKKHKGQSIRAVKPKDLPELLRAIEGYEGEPQTKLGLRLLALTFVRTGELRGAEWSEIDWKAAIWAVPAERMKMKTEHLVPLAPQAIRTLEELRELNGHRELIFPGQDPRKPISENTLLYALYRLGYHSRMTGHGFRSVASTVLNESGLFRGDVIERQLAHCERNAVRGAYNRAEYLPERQQMMLWWANYLSECSTPVRA
jgi:integrase